MRTSSSRNESEPIEASLEAGESSHLFTNESNNTKPSTYMSLPSDNDGSLLSNIDVDDEHFLHRGLKAVWNRYYKAMEKRPLLVKSITACLIIGSADLCAQGIENFRGISTYDGNGVDWARFARFAAIGLFGAPWSHFYFQYLDDCLPPTPEPFTGTTLLKVFIDQFIQAPLLLLVMICALSLMKLEGLEVMKEDVVQNFWPGLVANWKLWITASLVNLAFVKPELRVLYTNVVFFVWIIILSIILNTPT